MNAITDLINRYKTLLSTNPINPYYQNKNNYHKGIEEKIKELEKLITKSN